MQSQFDELAVAFDRSMTELPFRRHIEVPSVLAAIGDVTGRAVLDLGCGTGVYSRLLARRGARRVVGVDQSTGMIAYARHLEDIEPLGIEYVLHDAAADPGMAGAFDLVVAVYVLPYAPTFQALHQMCGTARTALTGRGGRFVAATLSPNFATEPDYYRPYGFTLTPAEVPPRDGTPVRLHSQVAGRHVDVTAYYWSAASHERAIRHAGFTATTWAAPHCDTDPAPFAGYLARPQTLILTATA